MKYWAVTVCVFDEQAVVALNGSPTRRIARAIIELNQADLDPHRLAQEKDRRRQSDVAG